VILARPGPEFYAEVTLATADTAKQVFYRIMPGDLQRLRFLVNNREYVAGQQQSDTAASQSLASFWQSIEEHPLRSTNGEPANAQEVPPAPAQAATAGEPQSESVAVTPQPPPATIENRYNYALHGIACGSAVGGCIGSWTGLTYLYSENPECSPAYSVYRVEPCVYWGAAIGATVLGTGAGYAMGNNLDRQATPPLPLPKQGSGGRIGYAIGAAVPGLALGTAFFLLAGGFHYGKTGLFDVVENDPSGLTYLPMALTGLSIAVEITTIGYRIGRAMDRKKAEETEARRRALGR
jgi:hypothetical protein